MKAELRRVEDRRKLETKVQQNNTGDVWTGMRDTTGRQPVSSLDGANELNRFFSRFSSQP